jgi:hypothetical protein
VTIAFGVACEDGVLLATDSMHVDWSTPWPTIDLDGSKFQRLSARLYYIASGYFCSSDPLLPMGCTDDRALEDLAPVMWETLKGRMVPAEQTHDGLERYAALLIAGGPLGKVPELMLTLPVWCPEALPAGRDWMIRRLRFGPLTST